MRQLFLIFTALLISSVSINAAAELSLDEQNTLRELIDSETRSEKARARNRYRNPFQTLNFFDVRSDLTVVEIWPGGQGGWYRSILQPYLAAQGSYIPVRESDAFPKPMAKVPGNSADRVLVFRAHGFLIYDKPTQAYYDALFKMLKPGGVFGIVDHRGDESVPQDLDGKNGYINQSHLIALAEAAGFKLLDSAEINANALDTKDYPNGLYSLPPSLRGSKSNKALRQKVLEIGESDRMTLKFVKPAASKADQD